MASNHRSVDVRDHFKDDESLQVFLAALAEFDRRFCDVMADGDDYTLRIEIHGNGGELIHCRVNCDTFKRPRGVERRVERAVRN